MATSTTTSTTIGTGARQLLLVLLALVSALVTITPASAQELTLQTEPPQPPPLDGPDDFQLPELAPALVLSPDCNPDGFHYSMFHPDAPEGAVYAGEYREAPDGPIQALPFDQPSGFVASGEGDFQVRGVIVNQGQLVHGYDWTDVTVFCPDIQIPPPGRTEVTIDVDPVCEPDAGLDYAIEATNVPNEPVAYKAQWRELAGDVVHTVDGQAGSIATGEGTFEIRGVLHDQGPGFHASDWAEVTVDCTEEPGGEPTPEPTPEDEPEGGLDPDDLPRPGTPTFTG